MEGGGGEGGGTGRNFTCILISSPSHASLVPHPHMHPLLLTLMSTLALMCILTLMSTLTLTQILTLTCILTLLLPPPPPVQPGLHPHSSEHPVLTFPPPVPPGTTWSAS